MGAKGRHCVCLPKQVFTEREQWQRLKTNLNGIHREWTIQPNTNAVRLLPTKQTSICLFLLQELFCSWIKGVPLWINMKHLYVGCRSRESVILTLYCTAKCAIMFCNGSLSLNVNISKQSANLFRMTGYAYIAIIIRVTLLFFAQDQNTATQRATWKKWRRSKKQTTATKHLDWSNTNTFQALKDSLSLFLFFFYYSIFPTLLWTTAFRARIEYPASTDFSLPLCRNYCRESFPDHPVPPPQWVGLQLKAAVCLQDK